MAFAVCGALLATAHGRCTDMDMAARWQSFISSMILTGFFVPTGRTIPD